MDDLIKRVQASFARDLSVSALKTMVVIWAIFIIILALTIDNPWLLAGILAYEILP